MRAINDHNARGAITRIVLYLRGSNSKNVKESMRTNPNFGAGKAIGKSANFWQALLLALIQDGYIGEKPECNSSGHAYSALFLHRKAKVWLYDHEEKQEPLMMVEMGNLKVNPEPKPGKKEKENILPDEPRFDTKWTRRFMVGPWKEIEEDRENLYESFKDKLPEMFEKLKEIRNDLAERIERADFVADDNMLNNFCHVRPTTYQSMLRVAECNQSKAEYCSEMIPFIDDYCIKHNLPTDVHSKYGSVVNQISVCFTNFLRL